MSATANTLSHEAFGPMLDGIIKLNLMTLKIQKKQSREFRYFCDIRACSRRRRNSSLDKLYLQELRKICDEQNIFL